MVLLRQCTASLQIQPACQQHGIMGSGAVMLCAVPVTLRAVSRMWSRVKKCLVYDYNLYSKGKQLRQPTRPKEIEHQLLLTNVIFLSCLQ